MLNSILLRAKTALTDRKGVTAAEYAVLAVGVVLVVALAASALGNGISSTFGQVISALGQAAPR